MAVKKNTKNRLIWFPLEILDKRYTAQTRVWYKREFDKCYDVIKIEGDELTSKIETGSFLDSSGTIYYKMSQFQKFAKMVKEEKIKDGDVLFFDDLWAPGLSSVKYVTQMGNNKLDIKIYGVYHAGSHIPSDDVSTNLGSDWCTNFEKSILQLVDGAFVGSNFHRKTIIDYFGDKALESKVINTGIPFYPSELLKHTKQKLWSEKEDIIVFPHRIHDEKHPELFDELEDFIKNKNLNIECVKTMDLNLDKAEYYDLLAKSKVVVSYADQENFGFSVLEAATFGNMLLLPDRVVYPEFYPNDVIFNDETYTDKITQIVDNIDIEPNIVQELKNVPYKFEKSIQNMVSHMKK